ncbi:MAG: SDR family oxidoreductase [Gaiellales bacterium]
MTDGVTGIGRATVRALLTAGARVVVGVPTRVAVPGKVSAGLLPNVDAHLTGVSSDGERVWGAPLDVGDPASVTRFHEDAVQAIGPVDILVNVATPPRHEPILRHTDGVWATVLDLNLHGAYRTTKECLPSMVEQRFGRIINVAPSVPAVGAAGHAAYSAAHAALIGLTRCAALEGAEHGVSCNLVAPSPADGGGSTSRLADTAEEGDVASGHAGQPMPRGATREERGMNAGTLGAVVVFLCTGEAFGITGQAIPVSLDG